MEQTVLRVNERSDFTTDSV